MVLVTGQGDTRTRPEDIIADKRRPFTGAEYIQSLRDGRQVYIDGDRVPDVIVHPAFRNSIHSIARLYDDCTIRRVMIRWPARRIPDRMATPTNSSASNDRGRT